MLNQTMVIYSYMMCENLPYHLVLLNTTRILFILTHTGAAQSNCFSNSDFGCLGTPDAIRTTSQECCDEGFLSFTIFGNDMCFPCTGELYPFST